MKYGFKGLINPVPSMFVVFSNYHGLMLEIVMHMIIVNYLLNLSDNKRLSCDEPNPEGT